MAYLITLYILWAAVLFIHPLVYLALDIHERRIDYRWNHGRSE